MRRFRYSSLLLLLCSAVTWPARADILLTFENLSEGDIVSNQFTPLGVTVGGGPMVVTAGSLLNEIDFPPHSGANVLIDEDGPISFLFAPGVSSVSGFFTYATQLTIDVFDPGGMLLTTGQSAGLTNFGSNEFFEFTGDIGSISIAGLPSGAGPSFTLDDLSFSPVPEPSAILLLLPVAAGVLRGLRKSNWR